MHMSQLAQYHNLLKSQIVHLDGLSETSEDCDTVPIETCAWGFSIML